MNESSTKLQDTISVLQVVHDTMVDGPGMRTTVYCAGCPNHCPGCHNPESWDIQHGTPVSVATLLDELLADPFADVTFSGGDPMFQAEAFARLADGLRERSRKTIWCYTGLTFEQVLTHPSQRALLERVDVLVDGPFILAQRDPDLVFRGSANQRVIDVPASLRRGEVLTIPHPEALFSGCFPVGGQRKQRTTRTMLRKDCILVLQSTRDNGRETSNLVSLPLLEVYHRLAIAQES